MDRKTILDKITEAKEKIPKRNFTQSVEISINFKNTNMEDAENKLNLSILLPKGRGKDVEIGAFADGDMSLKAKEISKHVLNKKELESYAESKRKMRKFADDCYSFVAQADLMPVIGKAWGIVLAPRGKMPQPIPANADLKPIISRLKNTVRIKSKKNPTVNVPVGVENMSPEDLTENIMAIMNAIEKQVSDDKIASVYFKPTMGQVVRLW